MADFLNYHFNESDIQALPLTAEHQPTIIKKLSDLAAIGEIVLLRIELVEPTDEVYKITFRAKEDTTTSVLTKGQFLMILSTGKLLVMNADTFNANYTFKAPGVVFGQGLILAH